MKPTMAIYLLVTGLVLFSAMTYLIYELVYLNNTAWTGMNNTDFENGFIMVMLPFAVLGFTFVLVMHIIKGGGGQDQGGRPQ